MPNTPSPTDEEIDLWQALETIWLGRWFVVLIAGLFGLGGLAYGLLAQEWYRAEVVLAPTSQQSTASSALAGLGLGGLANMAGINLPSAGEQQPLAVLKSKDFARDFITELDLMPELLKDEGAATPPDIRDAVRVFDTRVRGVAEDARTKLVRLSIRWKDPDTAALWANTLAKRLNERLRKQAAAEAERNVAYLQTELTATSVVSLQQSVGSMLEAEMKKLMLARGNEEFAFKVIDQAVPPKDRDAPKRVLIAAVSFVGGGILSILALLLRGAIRTRKPK